MRRIVLVFTAVAVLGVTVTVLAQPRPAFIVAKLTITDEDTYGNYRAGFGAVFQEFGGEIVAASGAPTVLEGNWDATTTVIIRFDSRVEALAWYNSDGYQELIRIRQSASTGEMILVDGR